MNRKGWVVIGIVVLLNIGLAIMQGQAIVGQITLKPVGASSGCAVDTTGDTICGATDGIYGSVPGVNGGAFAKFYPATGANGVSSWKGRTGDVLPATGDYTFSQVGGTLAATQMPSTQTCTFSATIAPTGGTITLSGCK